MIHDLTPMRIVSQRRKRDQRGLTLVELMISIAVLGVLASVAMPLAEVTAKRTKELELRRTLRQIRDGIDRFKTEYDKAKQNARDARETFKTRITADRSGYPLTLEEMVQTKILRRMPKDPMTREGRWVTRSYSDSLDATLTDERDVYDIRSASTATALDGSRYDSW
jgi:general secretion pathway protein G